MTRPARYAAHGRFIAPARTTLGLRPVILGFIIIESLYEIGQRALFYALQSYDPTLAEAARIGDTAPGLLINLCVFALLGLCVIFVLHVVHGLRARSLLGPPELFGPMFGKTFLAVALLFLIAELLFGGFTVPPDAACARSAPGSRCSCPGCSLF